MMTKPMLSLLATFWVVCAIQAETLTFHVQGGEGNLIRFESEAPLETVVGTTDRVTGTISLGPANLATGVSASISVEAASLKTGNKIRDGHMRNNHLQTDQYPIIRFTLKDSSLSGDLPLDQTRQFEVTGEFSLHGVTKSITVPANVTYSSDDSIHKLHVVTNFQVVLSDYNIPRPQFLIMKLDEVQKITVDIWGVTQ